MENTKAPLKEKPNYYAAYKELQALKVRLEKEREESAKKREEEREKELALQPLIAEYREDRQSAEKTLAGKTIKDACYIKSIGVWLLIFTDGASLMIGALPPNNGIELGGFHKSRKSSLVSP